MTYALMRVDQAEAERLAELLFRQHHTTAWSTADDEVKDHWHSRAREVIQALAVTPANADPVRHEYCTEIIYDAWRRDTGDDSEYLDASTPQLARRRQRIHAARGARVSRALTRDVLFTPWYQLDDDEADEPVDQPTG